MKRKKPSPVIDGVSIGYISYGGFPVCRTRNLPKDIIVSGEFPKTTDSRSLKWADYWPKRLRRELNRLHEKGVVTFGDATNKTRREIKGFKRIGEQSIQWMETVFRRCGLWFKPEQGTFDFE